MTKKARVPDKFTLRIQRAGCFDPEVVVNVAYGVLPRDTKFLGLTLFLMDIESATVHSRQLDLPGHGWTLDQVKAVVTKVVQASDAGIAAGKRICQQGMRDLMGLGKVNQELESLRDKVKVLQDSVGVPQDL